MVREATASYSDEAMHAAGPPAALRARIAEASAVARTPFAPFEVLLSRSSSRRCS